MIQLYDYVLSAECYKIRLLLSILQVDFATVKVNFHPGREHRRPDFLALNPLGTLPVLTDGDVVLRGAMPTLLYLAQTQDAERRWYPVAPRDAAPILVWLDFAEYELRPVLEARLSNLVSRDSDVRSLSAAGEAALEVLEDHLARGEILGRHWVAHDRPTIADLAIFPAAALASEADIRHDTKPAVWRWVNRVKRLPNFMPMPGILPVLE